MASSRCLMSAMVPTESVRYKSFFLLEVGIRGTFVGTTGGGGGSCEADDGNEDCTGGD